VSVEVAFSGGGVAPWSTTVQVAPLTSVLVDYPVPEPAASLAGIGALLGIGVARRLSRRGRGRACPRS
jgi:hypothetical protein